MYVGDVRVCDILGLGARAYAQYDAYAATYQDSENGAIRYVHPDGKYTNDGKRWGNATNRLQDAINSLRDYMEANHLTSGSVYVAEGTYIPTESTESMGGSMLNTSFKIYAGIKIYGGFSRDTTENSPADRLMSNDKTYAENWSRKATGTTSGAEIASQWDFKYKTILSGNHSGQDVEFTYDSVRGRYNTTYPANSYHVVWFATNGQYETDNDSISGHFRPLEHPALVDGCVITGGNASTRTTTVHEHTAFGGGAYLVANAELRNCTIEECSATLRGGGAYLDGGGRMEFCYVHTCQSLGVGVVQGYGGGVCIEYDGSVEHSHITQCASRVGGGVFIRHVANEYPWRLRIDPLNRVLASDTEQISPYSPFATACVINNNTAAAEAGGIYLAQGGTINHCTVTANACVGPDVTYYGRRHGRSGGVYIRNCGMIFNSVFWGNRCDINNDIQYASVRQNPEPTDSIYVYHSAFMNHDITDWTGTDKEMVFSLDRQNLPQKGSSANFPCFFNPTVDPTNWEDASLPGAGVFCGTFSPVRFDDGGTFVKDDAWNVHPEFYPDPRIWHLTSYSALDQKGVQVTDAVQDASRWVRHAHTDYGVVSNPYEPVSTLGALVRKPDPMSYALVAPQGVEGRNGGDPIPTLFIDPNRKGVFDSSDEFVFSELEGNCWDMPIKDIGEAIQFFRQYLVDDDSGNHHYRMPKLDPVTGKATGEDTTYNYVQILVKEGTITTAGPGNYLDWNIRTAAIRVESHMRLYGGYPKKLTGTSTSERNPRDYVSNITANITGIEGARGYANNAAHVIAMVNVEHSIVDGFTLSDANTYNVTLSNSAIAGGGVLVNNGTTPIEKRIHMTGNQLRNCVITNCSSPKGAAVYVNGEYMRSDGYVSYAELKMVNCVIRNNEAQYQGTGGTINDHGIVTANGRAYIEMEHCDIVNNVGYPFKADDKSTEDGSQITCTHPEHNGHAYHGFIRVNNSLIFCNGDRPLDNRGDLGSTAQVMSVFPDGQNYVFGEFNMFDKDLRLQGVSPLQPSGFFDPAFVKSIPTDFVPVIPGNTTFGASLSAPLPSDKHNQAIFTRANSSDTDYPGFVNPSRNVGVSTSGDKPLYGGTVSYAPLTTNPCVNAGDLESNYTANENYDRTDNCTRDRGGAPDIGAIENTDLPASGTILYVTPDGAGKRDGSSWANAIAGNTVYRLYDAPAATGDSIDVQNNARLVNATTGDPVLTSDNRYCGGFALRYIYTKFSDSGNNIARNIEINRYVGGDNPRNDTIDIDTTSTTSMSLTRYNNGPFPYDFVSTKAPDPNYPYGEMSGASRGMFRAAYNYSYFNEDGSSVMFSGDPTPGANAKGAAQAVASGRIIIRNERTENYVSGLQYAVEKASLTNKTLHKDTVQVWVSAGKYTDYKGYVMRDSVSVYGGFPISKYSAPGMDERRALLSNVVAIPKSKENQDLDAADYETILQISDVNPKGSTSAINSAAIKFKDDSTSVEYNISNNVSNFSDHNTVNYYRWVIGTEFVERTGMYIQYPDITSGGVNITPETSAYYHDDGVTSDVHYKHFGTAGDLDCWHLSYPAKENYIANLEDGSWNKDAEKTIYNPATGTQLTGSDATYSGNWIMIGNGSLAGLNLWQTMPNVPAGEFKLSVDMSCQYKNSPSTTTGLNMTLQILDASDNVLASEPLKSFGGNKDGNRGKAYRHTISFTNASAGNITIKLVIGDGNRNTTARNATYGTPTGVDPDPIPCSYVYNGANCTGSPWGGNNPNTREFWLSNVKLYQEMEGAGEYVFDRTETEDVTSKTINSTTINEGVVNKKSRTTLRKRVLFMPDVTSPVYGNGLGNTVDSRGKIGDPLSHYERVIKEGRLSNVNTDGTTVNGRHQDPNYKEYNNAYWDGFTIRHGFIYDQHMAHGGGAGVQMFEGGHLVNCIVTDNFVGCYGAKGGGVFCDGSNSTIENCFILNNTLTRGSKNPQQGQLQGGGMFLYEGTCFNSLLANNYDYGPGGGLALCVGKFYNNTLAYNTSGQNVGGLRIASGAASSILLANTIIYGNTGLAIDMTENSDYAPFLNCYIQSQTKITKATITHAINAHTADGDGNYGIENTFYNNQAPNASTSPFAADVNAGGTYTGNAKTNNDFALRQVEGIRCINSGTEDFAAALEEALAVATTTAIPNAKRTVYRNAVRGVELPGNDVVYANRVQDCQVDIGAYEYNAAFEIRPDTTTHPGKAIFYVCYVSPGGDASGRSPKNAGCKQKLQMILDAAGRYKNSLMTESRYNLVAPSPTADQPDKSWSVEVWLEGDDTNCTTSEHYVDWYTPTRSTKHSVANYHDNPLDYSFIVPHGIKVKGGYSGDFFHYEDAAGNIVEAGTAGAILKDERDPLTYRTVFSGKITANTGAEGNCFHVVTFTDDLFDTDEYLMNDEQNQLAYLSGLSDAEDHRAVLDGLFIEDGKANAPDPEDCIGAAAVVTGFAHIRNCVVQNNEAQDYGGALYLKPKALVSGTILNRNVADVGGAIYIEAPAGHSNDSLAHVFSTTIVFNNAKTTAGGMWFDNTYARVNSTVIWQNDANDFANVSGTFSRSSAETDYPFNFCAVESRRLEGMGNLELSPSETEGVRWDHQDPFDAILYYPIEMSSTLSRAGMTYREWNNLMEQFTTLDSIDIAGVSRTLWTIPGVQRKYSWGTDTLVTKRNDFIEIGARAINKTYEIKVDERYVMRRLYVMHTELLNSVAARALQDNPTQNNDTVNMYRQMGSCTLNPFHRLGDAFDYIIAARKGDTTGVLRNARFEVFVEKGTYYPYHNAYGYQDEVRMNTFLIPEATTVIGGVNSQLPGHNYGQEGYRDKFTNTELGNGSDVVIPGTGYTLNYALSDTIRLCKSNRRPMRDYNLNSVIEPWELDRQTILSGNAVSGDQFTHVYHVITIHADSTQAGPQPYKYRTDNPSADWRNGAKILTNPIAMNDTASFTQECDQSRAARAIILDGIVVTGGYANHLDESDAARHPYQPKTYFRGGGIFVDGNWTKPFEPGDPNIPNVTDPAAYSIPLIVRNSQFTDNMAGNGGAIYSNGNLHIYSCHFTQNYSQGPTSAYDQRFIPWSAGGCVAANAYCGIVNTLFDNNEAKRGTYPIIIKGADSIPNADARQGFGGVLSIASDAKMRVANCHFMKNKAVAYSAIYNFKPNSDYSTADSMQFAFNSIFWGNEVQDIDRLDQLEYKVAPTQAAIDTFDVKYKSSRAGVFHYDGKVWERYEKLFHQYDSVYNLYVADDDTFNVAVIAKLNELRQVGDSLEGLYFCSYRKTYGPSGMKPNKDGYLMTESEFRNYTDPRQLPVPTKWVNGDKTEDYHNLFSYVHGNNNVLINRINTATDGPNFKQPSIIAGIDGYMQNADWLLARMNLTTDQGWGHLKQDVVRGTVYRTKYSDESYDTRDEALAAALAYVQANIDPTATLADSTVIKSVIPHQGVPVASFSSTQDAEPSLYNFLAERTLKQFNDSTSPHLPIGSDSYMYYTRETSESESIGDMLRISTNPRLNISDVYIDLGVYEYQYVQLDLKGNEVDTMWVATKEKGKKHDGLTFETPTTDLQAAIDLLMSSHNNHDKYICFLGDAEQYFAPSNILDNRRAFIISSNSLSPLLPDSALADYDYGVKSLTFLGGYNYSVKDAARDPEANPTVIEMPNTGHRNQLNQLFVIEDMTRQMLQANWMGEYMSRDSVVIPVVFDGITFINPYSTMDPDADQAGAVGGSMTQKGGAAIYYRWQRRYTSEGGTFNPNFNWVLHPDSALIDGEKVTLPKLTISNCTFMDNGDPSAPANQRSSAVRIDQGAGSSLIVNSLFHSNAGAPIYAARRDMVTDPDNDLDRAPNDVIIVNSTFALNGGHVTLRSDNSEIHNSLIWLDDLANDTAIQFQMGSLDAGTEHIWKKDSTDTKIGIANRVTNNAFWGCFKDGDDTYHNDNLVTDNNSVFEGPYFVSPDLTASTFEERRARNFRLKPGVRTMNMADTAVYKNRVFFRMYPDTSALTHNQYWRRSNGFKESPIDTLIHDFDLAGKPRLFGSGMERGAYECRAVLQRVLYVQPTTPQAFAGDGSSWSSPFGKGQLQDAIDVAAVYTYLNRNEDAETRKAYVFVKGSYDDNTQTDIIARDGVSVFGSIPVDFKDTSWVDPELKIYPNSECKRYVNYIRSYVAGVGSPNAKQTRINSVSVKGDNDFELGFVLDGFVIKNPGTRINTSPVMLDDPKAAVRNCIIADNKVTDDKPVVDLKRGLLYNSLLYNDSAQTIVNVGANGLVLNNTIVASSPDVTTIDSSLAAPNSIINNIEGQDAVLKCFAPYLSQKNAYTLPNAFVRTGAPTFQLHEQSAFINAGVEQDALSASFDPFIADSTVCFGLDRDILGNPRRIGGNVDVGALETWRVEPKQAVEITALTNVLLGDGAIMVASDHERRTAFTEHFGGNAYPHVGSVVYLMDSSVMSMQFANTVTVDFYEMALSPAYMLLKSGASFYGNGHQVELNYVAAEKKFVNQQYSMTAFPFDYDTCNIIATRYYPTTDSLAQLKPLAFKTYQYSGAARSAKDYVFRAENSSLWLPVDTANRSATEGYLMDFAATVDTVLRFTAFGDDLRDYIYMEYEDADKWDKIVYLTQYDHRVAGTGTTLNFTKQEDMGWNMKGLPWLVSNYRTDTVLEEGNYQRQMFIPHVFYQMDGTGTYLTEGDQIYTSRSWDRGSVISMGNAFFTQTATQKDREAVYFHLPYYDMNEPITRPVIHMMSSRHQSDILTIIPDSTVSKNVQYSYGRDGMKWQANTRIPQVYLLDSKRLSRISLLGAAPTEVDIPLGVYVPNDLSAISNQQSAISNQQSAISTDFTFSLPEKEAFAEYPYVWFIDYHLNRYTNLLEGDYTVSLESGEHNSRFAVRIGGFPKVDQEGQRSYYVFVMDGTLYVRGLVEGDRITVYSQAGQLVHTATATGAEFTLPLQYASGYVVRVNDKSFKVVNL